MTNQSIRQAAVRCLILLFFFFFFTSKQKKVYLLIIDIVFVSNRAIKDINHPSSLPVIEKYQISRWIGWLRMGKRPAGV